MKDQQTLVDLTGQTLKGSVKHFLFCFQEKRFKTTFCSGCHIVSYDTNVKIGVLSQ